MWDWPPSWRCCSLPTTRQKQPNQIPLLTDPPQNAAVPPTRISVCAAAAEMLMSWLHRRPRRYILVILCSPFFIPVMCVTCPIICAIELFLLVKRRLKAANGGGERLVLPADGGDEAGLLQRYLEDQLMLVDAPPCEEEGEGLAEEEGVDVECLDSARSLLQ